MLHVQQPLGPTSVLVPWDPGSNGYHDGLEADTTLSLTGGAYKPYFAHGTSKGGDRKYKKGEDRRYCERTMTPACVLGTTCLIKLLFPWAVTCLLF